MNELDELYQQIIIDHSRTPKNFGILESKTNTSCGNNPLCGDSISIDMIIRQENLSDLKFNGHGCAVCISSASLMTQLVKEKSCQEVKELFELFHNMLTKDEDSDLTKLQKTAVLKGVKKFPIRIKCATLPWHTLMAAINNNIESVTTE